MSKIYLIIPFENKDDAKNLGVKFDWDKKLWYANNINKDKLLEKYKEYKSLENIIGENREFNGYNLFIDLIPTTSWYNNVRSNIYNDDWIRIRKYIYERVNYKCECCGLYCKYRKKYDDEYLDNNSYDKDTHYEDTDDEDSVEEDTHYKDTDDEDSDDINSQDLRNNNNEELKRWNTIQLEAHERWSYDDKTNIQKLERIVALCHRCHSVTHSGLAQMRGLSNQADKHLMKVNRWTKKKVLNHHREQTNIWRERNKIKWNIDLSIITNSGIKLKEGEKERQENRTIEKLNIDSINKPDKKTRKNEEKLKTYTNIEINNKYYKKESEKEKDITTNDIIEEKLNNIGNLFD